MYMYYIALVAPEEINCKVLTYKNFFREKFGCTAAAKSPAHITLIPPFWMNEELESELISKISAFSNTAHRFNISLHNFSTFAPRVIFIDVPFNEELQKLYENFNSYILSLQLFPIKKDDRPFHPHVTLATRDLYKKDFYKAMEQLASEDFRADWTIDGISLLRNDQKKWDVIATSHFVQ